MATASEVDHWDKIVNVDTTVRITMLHDCPSVLISLEARKDHMLEVVDVLTDLFVRRRIVDVPARHAGGVLEFAIDAVDQSFDQQRITAEHPD